VIAWRRNLFAVTAVSFIGFTGFTLVMPFLPLFIRQLGVSDVGEIALWAGVSLGVTPAVNALVSPSGAASPTGSAARSWSCVRLPPVCSRWERWPSSPGPGTCSGCEPCWAC
jgi:hypothetical protein